ncbi:MAG: ribosome small subunit-dependent GTPase A [Planctomycetota bacterium]|jgi:ribosome biogenesis GTPase
MNLDALGWGPRFEGPFEAIDGRGLSPGRVAVEERERYLVFGKGEAVWARVSGRFRHEAQFRSDFPVVGDWVAFERRADGGACTIRAVLPRQGAYSRKVAGTVTEEQVLAANVDAVIIVCGLDGDFRPRRIERMLAPAYESGALPVILLNKADLCDGVGERVEEVALTAPGVPVHAVSALRGTGLESVREHLPPGKTAVLVGSSGVGKSTLINALIGQERQKVAEVRRAGDRGRHTTSRRELLLLPSGGMIIDSPGIREVQLWSEGEGLGEEFADVEALVFACRFRDCGHGNEPGCAIREALETGVLDRGRFGNYLKMKRELAHLASRRDRAARQNAKKRWKKISVWSRKIKRLREREA